MVKKEDGMGTLRELMRTPSDTMMTDDTNNNEEI